MFCYRVLATPGPSDPWDQAPLTSSARETSTEGLSIRRTEQLNLSIAGTPFNNTSPLNQTSCTCLGDLRRGALDI